MGDERGAFSGALDDVGGSDFEPAAAAVVERLVAQHGYAALTSAAAERGRAAIAPFEGDAERGGVAYGVDLAAMKALPRSGLTRPLVFTALADVAAALRMLHAAGRAHGVLRPEMVRVDAAGTTTLLAPAYVVDAYALHVASVKSGNVDVVASAFLAPELHAGASASAATDTYALAACAYHALTGMLPVGQLDVRRAANGAPDWVTQRLYQALLAAPAGRPHMEALEHALRALGATAGAPVAPPSPIAPGPPRPPGSEVSTVLALVLIVGGIFVLTGALWLVAITWETLGELGHLSLLLMLSVGVLGAGEGVRKRSLEHTALALTTVGTQLFWADGAYVVIVEMKSNGAGPWTVVAALVTAITLGFALHRRSSLLASAAAIDFAIVAACLGAYLESGNPLGPALYAVCVAGAYAAVAAAGEAWVGRAVGVPFAVGAVLASVLSALCAVVLLSSGNSRVFATAWPYVVIVVVALPWMARTRAPYAEIGAVVALLLLTGTPTLEAIIRSDDVAYLVAAIAVGAVGATASFVSMPFKNDPALQVAMTCVGVASVIGGPGFFALAHIDDDKSTVYLALALTVGAFLVMLSYALSSRAASKTAYRVLEAAGLALFFGLLTIDSVLHLDSWMYPGVLLVGGVVMLGLGMATKRAAPVAFAATALLVNAWLQYFAKLKDQVPVSLLCVGFGLSLLAGGLLFEKKMRPLLPAMKEWA